MDRTAARKALSKKTELLFQEALLNPPHRGWIKATREALGMSAAQLGHRMGVSQPRVATLEKSEIKDTVTLESLRRAAEALDCILVYAIVPKTSLDDLVMRRARTVAAKILGRVNHTMTLEKQNIGHSEIEEHVETLARSLVAQNSRLIWDEDRL